MAARANAPANAEKTLATKEPQHPTTPGHLVPTTLAGRERDPVAHHSHAEGGHGHRHPHPAPRGTEAEQHAHERGSRRRSDVEPAVEGHQSTRLVGQCRRGRHIDGHVYQAGYRHHDHDHRSQHDGLPHGGAPTEEDRPTEQRCSQYLAGAESLAQCSPDGVGRRPTDQGHRQQEAEPGVGHSQRPLHVDGRHRPAAPEGAEQEEDPTDGTKAHNVFLA